MKTNTTNTRGAIHAGSLALAVTAATNRTSPLRYIADAAHQDVVYYEDGTTGLRLPLPQKNVRAWGLNTAFEYARLSQTPTTSPTP